jgi:hypothetical protein
MHSAMTQSIVAPKPISRVFVVLFAAVYFALYPGYCAVPDSVLRDRVRVHARKARRLILSRAFDAMLVRRPDSEIQRPDKNHQGRYKVDVDRHEPGGLVHIDKIQDDDAKLVEYIHQRNSSKTSE